MGLLCQNVQEKPVIMIVVSDDLIKDRGLKAGELTRAIADKLGFRGGGKPHMAQVGVPNISDFSKIENFVKASLESLV